MKRPKRTFKNRLKIRLLRAAIKLHDACTRFLNKYSRNILVDILWQEREYGESYITLKEYTKGNKDGF